MNPRCQDIQEQMLSLEGPSEVLQAHLDGCQECRELWGLHHSASRLGRELRQARSFDGATEGFVLQRIESKARARASRKGWPGAWLWGSLSAAALGVLFFWTGAFPPPTPAPAKRSPQVKARKAAPPIVAANDALVEQALSGLSDVLRWGDEPRSLSADERLAIDWGRDLQRDADDASNDSKRWLASTQIVDPAPISQRLPDALQPLHHLVKAVERERK